MASQKYLTHSKMPFIFSSALFLLPSFAFLSSDSTSIIALMFGGTGLFYLLQHKKYLQGLLWQEEKLPLLALLLCALLLIALNLYHGERWSTYHLPVAILIITPAFFAFAKLTLNPRIFWSGCSTGSFLSLAYAVYEIFVLHADRAGELVSNPIPFGSICMVLAAGSIIGFQSDSKKLNIRQLFAILGLVAGVAAAVLSGSKGSLLAMPILAYLMYVKCIKDQTNSLRLLILTIFFVFFALTLLHPKVQVLHRITEAFWGAAVWIDSGGVADDSIGPRLELIKFGIDASTINPLLGIGRGGLVELIQTSTKNGLYDPYIGHLVTLHNEFLNILVTKGLIGLLSLASIYIFFIAYFFKNIKYQHEDRKNISYMGLSLCLMFLIFGVGEVAIQLSFLRNFFLIFLVAMLGLSCAQRKRRD